jgi:hypothetical protein
MLVQLWIYGYNEREMIGERCGGLEIDKVEGEKDGMKKGSDEK